MKKQWKKIKHGIFEFAPMHWLRMGMDLGRGGILLRSEILSNFSEIGTEAVK